MLIFIIAHSHQSLLLQLQYAPLSIYVPFLMTTRRTKIIKMFTLRCQVLKTHTCHLQNTIRKTFII